MHNIPSDVIHSMSGIALHDLWYNRLCHTSQDSIKDIHKHCEGVPNLKQKNPLFHCNGWDQNITKKSWGYNKNPTRAKCKGKCFNFNFKFVKSSDIKEEDTIIMIWEGYLSYPLMWDVYSSY